MSLHSQHRPSEEHQRAQVPSHTQLPFPSHVSNLLVHYGMFFNPDFGLCFRRLTAKFPSLSCEEPSTPLIRTTRSLYCFSQKSMFSLQSWGVTGTFCRRQPHVLLSPALHCTDKKALWSPTLDIPHSTHSVAAHRRGSYSLLLDSLFLEVNQIYTGPVKHW